MSHLVVEVLRSQACPRSAPHSACVARAGLPLPWVSIPLRIARSRPSTVGDTGDVGPVSHTIGRAARRLCVHLRVLNTQGSIDAAVVDLEHVRISAAVPGRDVPQGSLAEQWRTALKGNTKGQQWKGAIANLPARGQCPAMTVRQTFHVTGGPAYGRRNLPRLRAELARKGLDGFIIPHEDEYNNEYLPDCAERLAWATGFTGSAGAAVVFADRAALLVDGRYTAQAKVQADPGLFEVRDLVTEGVAGALTAMARPGQRIGYDPRLASPDVVQRWKDAAAKAGVMLTGVPQNPIDAAWRDRPAEPVTLAVPHALEHAGEAASDKRARLAAALAAQGADAAVLTFPASIAWLFNIRGGDVARTPLTLGAAILHQDATADLYLDARKVTPILRAHLGAQVTIKPPADFESDFKALAGKVALVDPSLSSAHVFDRLAEAGVSVLRGVDPTTQPRAAKNAVEIEGARQAHARDGAALSRFLHWLASEAQDGSVDEITAARKLEDLRCASNLLRDLSFDSISGAGPNAALPHYRVTEKTNRKLKRGSVFLIDSGGQYLDGTTDVTRTVAIGKPGKEIRDRFTRVLKGHIALARVRFPKGTTGSALDALARLSLWEAGLDYDHGTGHGVGSYLGVHEGPHRIAKPANNVALEPGMIVSNEPGFYKPGAYGIRTENLQVVTPAEPIAGGDREMLGFETLTLAPIDRALIDRKLLTKDEIAWLNAYHAKVRAVIAPLLDGPARDWLEAATAPI